MPGSSARRDPDEVRAGLVRWRGSEDGIGELRRPSDGLSSETYVADSLVLRLPPPNAGLFPRYDLRAQGELQDRLAAAGIPTASPVVYEPDPAWLGAPFLVMPRIEGEVPSDNPPYHRVGWLHDATPEVQRRALQGFLDQLAAVHRQPAPQPGGLRAQLDWWEAYLDWAGVDALRRPLEWCRAHMPGEAEAGLLWGDVRLGNVVFGPDGHPAALLDFEMAGSGPAEVDLGWFFALREMMVGRQPELPGFFPREEALAYYGERLGRPVVDLEWYEVFALVRSAAILARMQKLLVEVGERHHWLVGFDPVPPRLKRL